MQPVCIKNGSWVCFITLNLILLSVITTAYETEACCSQWAAVCQIMSCHAYPLAYI